MSLLRIFKKVALRASAGKIRFQHFWDTVANISYEARGIGAGSGKKNANGEMLVIEQIAKQKISSPIIFDVGANIGDYSHGILTSLSKKQITPRLFCFEPSRKASEVLKKRLAGFPYKLFQVALSNKSGESVMFTDSEGSDLASLHNLDISYRPFNDSISFKVNLTCIDDFLHANDIAQIDFLKIDAEGHDYFVLEGAKRAMENGLVKMIQFEFGPPNITSKVFFRDFWNLLHERYAIYRIIAEGFYPITKYHVGLEIFHTTNFLAILK